jgi:uncharacterized protein YndB with AHSA1/START domain
VTTKSGEQIRKSVFIAADPARVFRTLTRAEDWDQFFTTGMELDPRPGGVCNFKWKNWGPELLCLESPGKVLAIEPPQRLVFEWGRTGQKTVAQFDVERRHDGTVLQLTAGGYPDTPEGRRYMVECAAHWGELLALIKFYIEFGHTYVSPTIQKNS